MDWMKIYDEINPDEKPDKTDAYIVGNDEQAREFINDGATVLTMQMVWNFKGKVKLMNKTETIQYIESIQEQKYFTSIGDDTRNFLHFKAHNYFYEFLGQLKRQLQAPDVPTLAEFFPDIEPGKVEAFKERFLGSWGKELAMVIHILQEKELAMFMFQDKRFSINGFIKQLTGSDEGNFYAITKHIQNNNTTFLTTEKQYIKLSKDIDNILQ